MHVFFGKPQFIANGASNDLHGHTLAFISHFLFDVAFVSLGTLGMFHSLIQH
jgi:hypothetical protein